MKKGRVLPIVLGIASLALAIASYLLLPDTVVTQLSLGGSGATTMPKLSAVLLPALLGIGGAVFSLASKRENDEKDKGLIVSAAGVVVFAIMLITNL